VEVNVQALVSSLLEAQNENIDDPCNEENEDVYNTRLLRISMRNCKLMGTLYTLQRWCYRNTQWQDPVTGFRNLLDMNFGENRIEGIRAQPQYAQSLRRVWFDQNNMTELDRQWLGERLVSSTQFRRVSPVSFLDVTNNPSLEITVDPPTGTCSDLSPNSSLATDPSSYSNFSLGVDCALPCNPFGVLLRMDAATPSPDVCRCQGGYGWLPGAIPAPGEPNLRSCEKCPAETYSYSDRDDIYKVSSTCLECPANSTTNGIGGQLSVCNCECMKGTYLDEGFKCGKTREQLHILNQSFTRNPQCTPCAEFRTTTREGATSPSQCICDRSITGIVDQDDCGCEVGEFFNYELYQCWKCKEEGEICDWGTFGTSIRDSVRPPHLREGYWARTGWLVGTNRSDYGNFGGHYIYKCTSDTTCIDEKGTCAFGRDPNSIACSLCIKGWTGGREGDCRKCEGSAVAPLFLVLIVVPLIVTSCHVLISGSAEGRAVMQALRSFRVSMRQLVKHMQVVGVVGGFTIGWPIDVSDVFDIVSLFTFNLLDTAGISCLAETPSAAFDVSLRFAFPFLLVLIGIVFTPLVAVPIGKVMTFAPIGRVKSLGHKVQMNFSHSSRATFWLMILFFTTWLQNGLILFTCNRNPNGELTVADYPHLHCLGSRSGADSEWMEMVGPGIIYNVIILGLGVGVYIFLWRSTWHHMEETDFMDRGHYTFLFEDFRDAAVHWPIILLGRDVFLNLTGAALNNYGATQLMITACGSLLIGYCCLKDHPYVDASNTLLEVLNSLSVFTVCVFTAGMGFAQEPGVGDLESLTEGSQEAQRSIELRSRILLGFQLISLFGPMLIISYQLLILIPWVQAKLPSVIRPLQVDEEDHLRLYLREELQIATGEVVNARQLHIILDKLDGHDLMTLGTLLHAAPASTGILRDKGHPAGTAHLITRAKSKIVGSGTGSQSLHSLAEEFGHEATPEEIMQGLRSRWENHLQQLQDAEKRIKEQEEENQELRKQLAEEQGVETFSQ